VAVLLGFALPVSAQYAGPAVLSRGEAPSAMSWPDIRFRPFVEVSGTWDTGLAAVKVSDSGELAKESSLGMGLAWGVSGTHSWRYTKLGVSYRGGLNHYFRDAGFDNLNQSMLIGLTRRLTPRMTMTINSSAGIFTRDYGLLGLQQTVPFDPATTSIPRTDFFDNRTIHLSTVGTLIYQRTARLSFSFSGNGFTTRRRSQALYGVVGAGAQSDVQYRLTRRVTVGGSYAYQHYDFTKVLGVTDGHGVAGSFAFQLSRLLEFSAYAGAIRVETKFSQTVPLAPAIVALLGITESQQIVHSIFWVPQMGARLSRTFENGVAYLGVGHGITPGNGLFLTSTMSSAFAGYAYTGLRRWSLGAFAGYYRGSSKANIRGAYSNLSGSVAASRQIKHGFHFTAHFSARNYDSPSFAGYNRLIYTARVGLSYSPGDLPLRIW
jgi:hypothetical protein